MWIGALLRHYAQRDVTPVILLDARTDDDTGTIAESFGCRVVEIENFHATEGVVSVARSLAPSPWALFMHDDEVPCDGLFARLRGDPPSGPATSIAIPRRWAWYEPGQELRYGCSDHWNDRTGRHGLDHHWRLFQPHAVAYICEMHTDGFLIGPWARVPEDEYIVHFEWVLRDFESRVRKVRRYDERRPGYGKFFENIYLPESQPPGRIQYAAFATHAFDGLADAYWAARCGAAGQGHGLHSLTTPHPVAGMRQRLRAAQPEAGGLAEREFLLPKPQNETAAWTARQPEI